MDWKQTFSVGIPEIDAEHQILVRCITILEDVADEKQSWIEVHSALDQLSNYADTHFKVEEALMQICQYPSLEEHIAEHRYFCEHIDDLKRKALSVNVREPMNDFLRTWLANHIMGRDRHYAEWIIDKTGLLAGDRLESD